MSDKFIKKEDVNRVFSGQTPLPVGVRLSGAFYDDNNELVEYSQTITPLSDQPTYLQNIIREVERKSLNHPTLAFREVAAMVFLYEDASLDVRFFSSDLNDRVYDDAHFVAIEDCSILDVLANGLAPSLVVHVHSHPGIEYKSQGKEDNALLINAADYRAYQKLSSFLTYYADGREIPMVGIVRPVGTICGDVVMQTQAEPFANDNTMRDKADQIKALRPVLSI